MTQRSSFRGWMAKNACWCLCRCALGFLACFLAMGLALYFGARAILAPQADEWSVQWGPKWMGFVVSVPMLVRLGTSPWAGAALDGIQVNTSMGRWHLQWESAGRFLRMHCSPCVWSVPGAGSAPVQVHAGDFTMHRYFDELQGRISLASATGARVHAQWTGKLQRHGMQLALEVEPTALAQWYAVLAPELPELRYARIDGTLAISAQIQLPPMTMRVKPVVDGFAVYGLGTQRLVHVESSCAKSSGLQAGSWLARAVLASEDQRFFEHAGYDLHETLSAHQHNQAGGARRRGASSLTQQLAKLLYTGDERSVQRKLRELLYAVEMERTLGKQRILNLYLDHAPWGHGVCGAEAAARHYFHQAAKKLTAEQAVWLAAMLHNPEMENRNWRKNGGINLQRARWVAGQVRGIQRSERARLLKAFAQEPGWTPPSSHAGTARKG